MATEWFLTRILSATGKTVYPNEKRRRPNTRGVEVPGGMENVGSAHPQATTVGEGPEVRTTDETTMTTAEGDVNDEDGSVVALCQAMNYEGRIPRIAST